MDPATLALIVSTLAQLLGGGGETKVTTGAEAPAGAQGQVGTGFQLPTPGADTGVSSITPDTSFLNPLSEQFQAVQAIDPTTVPLSAAPADGFGPTTEPTAPAPAPAAPVPPATPPAGIGEILAANPEALLAVAQFLGLGQSEQGVVRGAPAAGGPQGSLIPGLQLPQSGQVGALLRQIPGLV